MLKTSSFHGETWGIRHWEFSTMDRLRGAGHKGLRQGRCYVPSGETPNLQMD